MLRSIPWDFWAAAAIAVVVCLLAMLDLTSAIFVAIYLALCAYVIAETISNETDGR